MLKGLLKIQFPLIISPREARGGNRPAKPTAWNEVIKGIN